MAYEWCSVISDVAGRLSQGGMQINRHSSSSDFFWIADEEFSHVGPGCDVVHSDNTSHARELPQGLTPGAYVELLLTTLIIAFRLVAPDRHWTYLDLTHTHHHDQVFEAAFSSDDDEVIADVVCAWIAGTRTPTSSFVCYFAKRLEKTSPLSPRLRQVTIRAMCRIRRSELTMSTIRLLHRLNADVDDVGEAVDWVEVLVWVIRSPMGFESLSSHYWRLLGKLTSPTRYAGLITLRDMEVMRSLEETEDWEKLEVWMAVVWRFFYWSAPQLIDSIEQVTEKLASRQPSALQRFEDLCERGKVLYQGTLRGICGRARMEQSALEPPPLL